MSTTNIQTLVVNDNPVLNTRRKELLRKLGELPHKGILPPPQLSPPIRPRLHQVLQQPTSPIHKTRNVAEGWVL